ncbi:hypothetical protein OROMI_030702 [Orobanche minor]
MPITDDEVADSRYWRMDSKGEYSAKSAYRMLRGNVTDYATTTPFRNWKSLWSLKVPQVTGIWQHMCPMISVLHADSLQDWFQKIILLHHDNAVSVASCLSSIWYGRNQLIWKNKQWSEQGIIRTIKAQMDSWRTLRDVDKPKRKGKVGFGAILCDHDGAFLKATNGVITSSLDPLMAEAMALKEAALSCLKGMAVDNVVVEMDCQQLILRLDATTVDRSHMSFVFRELI